MPQPRNLVSTGVDFSQGYFPNAKSLAPGRFQDTIRAGNNAWLRPGGVVEVANGLLEVSATNVGARIFAADTTRASIAGGLNGDLLPYAGLIRYLNAVLLYLSENTSAQVYLNETSVVGLTTSSTAGRLRVAVPNSGGTYDVFDAGFDKPTLLTASVSFFTVSVLGALKPMAGQIGVAIAPWRSKTNATGPPSEIVYQDIPPSGATVIRILLPAGASGQDGWIFCGTQWGDQGGSIRVVRYVYIQARGTFTATNGSPLLTAGVNTRFIRDLRAGDLVTIDGTSYQVGFVGADDAASLQTNFLGATGSGKTATITDAAANWYNSELGQLVNRDIQRPPRAAGILKYGDRAFLWGVSDTTNLTSTSATGNALTAMLDDNPEHVGLFSIGTASGSNLVNVLATDGPLYLMTTTGLELLTFTGDPQKPYTLRTIAEPGFAAGTNGVLQVDYFYGFNGQPFRTRAEENIDLAFAEPVADEMRDWNAARVMLAVDPKNNAVLYIHDNGTTTEVIPWMAQQGVWGAPLTFSDRIIDTQVVNGTLYLIYLSAGSYHVNEWEGGAGAGNSPYVATQYLDPNQLKSNRLKRITPVGKIETVRVYAATPGAAVPDVSDTAQAAASFAQTDLDRHEATIFTNIPGDAFALRFDFDSSDGNFQSAVVSGTPRTEQR